MPELTLFVPAYILTLFVPAYILQSRMSNPYGNFEQPSQPPGGVPPWNPSQNPYSSPQYGGRPPGLQRSGGTVALILGISSIVSALPVCVCGICGVLFAVVGMGLGIAAIVIGSKELALLKAEGAPESALGNPNAGRICGIVGTTLNALAVVFLLSMIALGIAAGAFQGPGGRNLFN
jgi:hypothetical protein